MQLDHVTTAAAKQVMLRTLEAQNSGQYVEWKPIHARVHTSGYADPTGFVSPGASPIRFFQTTQGSVGNGFTRMLTAADTWLQAGDNTMPAGVEFVIFEQAVQLNPEMPPWIKESLAYYSEFFMNRQLTKYTFGQIADWGDGGYGLQASAASTTVANTTINQATNGRLSRCLLPDDARIALPAKQPIGFQVSVFQGFYSTTNGQAVGSGGAQLINNGAVDVQPIGTFQREVCGMMRYVGWGYQFTLAGN